MDWISGALGLGRGLVDLGKTLLTRKTEREKLSHEERKQALDAEKRKRDVKARNPIDSLDDGSF